MRYRVTIEQDEDGVSVAEVPALPGCISQGRTRAEAIDNVKEAIAAYIESLDDQRRPHSTVDFRRSRRGQFVSRLPRVSGQKK